MSVGLRYAVTAVLTAFAGMLILAAGGPAFAMVVIGLPVLGAVLLLAGRRPERAALVIGVLVVVAGSAVTLVDVAGGVIDGRVECRGELPTRAEPDDRLATVSNAEATMSVPGAGAGLMLLWVIAELAPWALGAYILVRLAPVLRAAERGDPFWDDVTAELTQIGVFLLVGIPAIAILRYVVGYEATAAAPFAVPIPDPQLSLSPWYLLPGVVVLALAGIYRRGGELRELDRHTV